MRQYRIVRGKDGNASALCRGTGWRYGIRSFAKRRITNKTQRLKSGENGVIMDLAAPNARAAQLMVQKLKEEVFADKPLKALRVAEGKAELTEVAMMASMMLQKN